MLARGEFGVVGRFVSGFRESLLGVVGKSFIFLKRDKRKGGF